VVVVVFERRNFGARRALKIYYFTPACFPTPSLNASRSRRHIFGFFSSKYRRASRDVALREDIGFDTTLDYISFDWRHQLPLSITVKGLKNVTDLNSTLPSGSEY
jgi:hypothetical protein